MFFRCLTGLAVYGEVQQILRMIGFAMAVNSA